MGIALLLTRLWLLAWGLSRFSGPMSLLNGLTTKTSWWLFLSESQIIWIRRFHIAPTWDSCHPLISPLPIRMQIKALNIKKSLEDCENFIVEITSKKVTQIVPSICFAARYKIVLVTDSYILLMRFITYIFFLLGFKKFTKSWLCYWDIL